VCITVIDGAAIMEARALRALEHFFFGRQFPQLSVSDVACDVQAVVNATAKMHRLAGAKIHH
jgi:hypothetical protein